MARRTVLLIAAIVVAALGTALVALYVQSVDQRALNREKPVHILMAKKTIPAGMTVAGASEAGDIERESVPRNAVAPGALSDINGIETEVALAPIFPGEQLLEQKFGKPGDSTALSIPDPGTLAVSVSLGQPQRVNDFVVPGSHVAVFVTNGGSTRLLLPNAKVIAIGPRTLVPSSGQSSSTAQSGIVTFGVSQGDAQKLILAQSSGSLYLALLPNSPAAGTQSTEQS